MPTSIHDQPSRQHRLAPARDRPGSALVPTGERKAALATDGGN